MDEGPALSMLAAGDTQGASAWVIRAYGAEVCGYVLSLVRDADDAAEAFAVAAELLFRNIATFRGQASLRTWFYRIARNAAYADRRRRAQRKREDPISQLDEVLQTALRTATLQHQKSEVKDAVAALRASLSREDRELLVLRVDRDLSWSEIALVLLGDGQPHGEAELKREAARARKQFERAKEQLRVLAQQAGLLD